MKSVYFLILKSFYSHESIAKALGIFVATTIFTNTSWASPIDDASSYAVRVKSTVRYAFAEEKAGTSEGAGFLVDQERGWILTNAHVAGYGTGDIEVSFKGQDYFEVTPMYVDSELDVAIIKAHKDNIPEGSLKFHAGKKELGGFARILLKADTGGMVVEHYDGDGTLTFTADEKAIRNL